MTIYTVATDIHDKRYFLCSVPYSRRVQKQNWLDYRVERVVDMLLVGDYRITVCFVFCVTVRAFFDIDRISAGTGMLCMRKAINQNHNIIKFRRKEEALGAILKLVICLGESNRI